MTTTASPAFFGSTEATDLLDDLVDEAAGSLSLLSEFELGEPLAADAVEDHTPGGGDAIRISFRIAFTTGAGIRVGFLQMPLQDALVLAGSLMMLPTDDLRNARAKSAPDSGDKEAIMEVGALIGGSFAALLRKQFDDGVSAMFAGCQGVAAASAAWLPHYDGEPLAVRRHSVSFRSFEPFELLLAIPA